LKGFYKDLSIMGGVLLLCTSGAGKYSIEALLGIACGGMQRHVALVRCRTCD
jgi:uncharacterized membrane protein YphA (DoxX/SURF4 family)